MELKLREPRYRFFIVRGEDILSLLGNWRHGSVVSLPKISGLPDGYVVDGVTASFERNGILLRIYHPSFDLVLFGEIPMSYEPAEYETVELPLADPK